MALTWLNEPTVDALRAALRTVAADLADGTIEPRGLEPSDDPQWSAASAVVEQTVAGDLAAVLAGLHDPDVLKTVYGAMGPLPEPTAHASADALRARFGALIGPDHLCTVLGDALWRAEAGVALPDHRTPAHFRLGSGSRRTQSLWRTRLAVIQA